MQEDNLKTDTPTDANNVLAGRCSSCKFWGRTKESEYSKDMGKCERLSAPKGEDYPDLEITGIESTPLCSHDGAGSEYETKGWFGCVHYNAR
jgi:hypothetical protein